MLFSEDGADVCLKTSVNWTRWVPFNMEISAYGRLRPQLYHPPTRHYRSNEWHSTMHKRLRAGVSDHTIGFCKLTSRWSVLIFSSFVYVVFVWVTVKVADLSFGIRSVTSKCGTFKEMWWVTWFWFNWLKIRNRGGNDPLPFTKFREFFYYLRAHFLCNGVHPVQFVCPFTNTNV